MCRKLNADEISVSIGTYKEADKNHPNVKPGASLLLYKDARVDMKILDELYGTFGWQKTYQKIGDSMFCTISVYDKEKQQWISKQDVGTESNMEATKGEASDAFKRAGFNFGIGRELYTAPFIWVPGDLMNSKYDKFHVEEIGYTDDAISFLKIFNDTKRIVAYQMADGKKTATAKPAATPEPKQEAASKLEEISVESIRTEMERTGITEKTVLDMFKVSKLEDLNDTCRRAVMAKFSHTETKA